MKKTLIIPTIALIVLATSGYYSRQLFTPDKLDTTSVKEIAIEMIPIQGGKLSMCAEVSGEDEETQYLVSLSNYSMGKYEVTQAQWAKVMGYNPSLHKDCSECPVDNISWQDIQLFIQKLNKMTGRHYRLPSDAEWEFASIGGKKSREYLYSGSNDMSEVGWCRLNSGGYTHPVGQLQANELGLFDMTGNVWEWCQDWYDPQYYSPNVLYRNPSGPTNGQHKILRGASWYNYPNHRDPCFRIAENPEKREINYGFRIAL